MVPFLYSQKCLHFDDKLYGHPDDREKLKCPHNNEEKWLEGPSDRVILLILSTFHCRTFGCLSGSHTLIANKVWGRKIWSILLALVCFEVFFLCCQSVVIQSFSQTLQLLLLFTYTAFDVGSNIFLHSPNLEVQNLLHCKLHGG